MLRTFPLSRIGNKYSSFLACGFSIINDFSKSGTKIAC